MALNTTNSAYGSYAYGLLSSRIISSYATLAAYFSPTAAVVAAAANVANFVIFLRLDGVGSTARIYYLSLAVLDFCEAIVLHLFGYFLAVGVEYASQMFVRVTWLQNHLGCVVMWFLKATLISSTNWIYVLFTAERTAVVFCPIMAHRALTSRIALFGVLVVVITSASLATFCVWITNAMLFFGTWMCMEIPAGIFDAIALYFTLSSSYILAPLINVVLLIAIVRKLRDANRQRRQVVRGSTVATRNHDGTTITLLVMAALHCTLYFANGVAAVVALSSAAVQTNTLTTLTVMAFMMIDGELLVVTNFANFVIYAVRIQRFRNRLLCRRVVRR
jgi:hypothetical protein